MTIKNLNLLTDAQRAGVPMTVYTDPDSGDMELIPSHAAEARRIFREQWLAEKREVAKHGGEWGLFRHRLGCDARGCVFEREWRADTRAWEVLHNHAVMEVRDRASSRPDDLFALIAAWVCHLHRASDEKERDKLIYETSGA